MKIENLIKIGDAARVLGVSSQRVYAMINEGKIKPTIIGNTKFFNRLELEKLKKK